MKPFIGGLIAGAFAGVLGAALALRRPGPPPAPCPAPEGDHRLEEAQREIVRLSRRIQELESPPAAPAPAANPAQAPATRAPTLEARFASLLEKGLSGLGGSEMRALLDEVKARAAEGVAFLARRLREGSTSQERFLAAAALEGAGDPAAIPALAEALRKDPDDLVRRMASHAIAVLGTEAADAPLGESMAGDRDWGVRVNSAYGLAKRGRDDGLRMLEGAYTSAETPAEYRLAILGGLADVAAPSTAPLFRRILTDTTEPAYLLMAVNALSKMKDAGSRAALERLAAAEGVSDAVREAARKAAAALGN